MRKPLVKRYVAARTLGIAAANLCAQACFFTPTGSPPHSNETSSGGSTEVLAADMSTTSTTEPEATGGPSDVTTGPFTTGELVGSTSSSGGSTGEPRPACGDGIISPGEVCDDGEETALCDDDCSVPACGDGVLNEAAGEACDDGDVLPGDACSMACVETKITDVALGIWHTCVLFESGSIRCWGANGNGQLQLGHKMSVPLPPVLPVPDLDLAGFPAEKVVAGSWHTCRLSSGNVYCWGSVNMDAGYFESGPDSVVLPRPKMMLPMGQAAKDIATGGIHACAILLDNTVACWGNSEYGQLGRNTVSKANLPGLVIGIEGVEALALGEAHTCALKAGAVYCWGRNDEGQLGLGHTKEVGNVAMANENSLPMPPPPADLGGKAVQLSAGLRFTCAILESGQVVCWGHNGSGQLGNGKQGNVGDGPDEMGAALIPVDLGEQAEQVAAGPHHACALLSTGTVKCWGRASAGALGYGNTENIDQPVELAAMKPVDLGIDAVLIRSNAAYLLTGYAHDGSTCALLADGTMRCWGVNTYGQLGYGHTDNLGDNEPLSKVEPVPF